MEIVLSRHKSLTFEMKNRGIITYKKVSEFDYGNKLNPTILIITNQILEFEFDNSLNNQLVSVYLESTETTVFRPKCTKTTLNRFIPF